MNELPAMRALIDAMLRAGTILDAQTEGES
jgi:hypothetical protein